MQTAFRLFLAAIVLGLINSVLGFVGASAQIDAALAAQPLPPGVSREQFQTIAMAGFIGAAVFGLVLVALEALVVFQMRKGRNWARIVLAIIGALTVVAGLINVGTIAAAFASGGLGILTGLLSIVTLLVTIAAIYYMFRPAANAYFSAVR